MTYGAYRRVSISGVYTKGVRKRRRFYWKTGKRRDRLRNRGQVPGTRTRYTSSEPICRRVIRLVLRSSGGWTGSLAFHHGTFTSSDYSSAYSTVGDAATAGFVYSDTRRRRRIRGEQVNSVTITSDNTTYTWEPPNDDI